MIPDEVLDEIRNRLPIEEVLSDYIELKKSGARYTALCPFHKEKTPSFSVNPVGQYFKCFGCHKGGNIFTFVLEMEGMSFPETVRKLADRAGVTIPENNYAPKQKPIPSNPKIDRQIEANTLAAKYYSYLFHEVKGYEFAKKYLQGRGISEETAKKFGVGVSAKGWNGLRDVLVKKGFTVEELIEAGLVIESKQGGYDRFRERLMFPIRNIDGQVIGFGARLLKDEPNQPKYLNSSESKLFTKRNELYGLFENQRHIRRRGEALIVEGYMDVVGLYEKGVKTAVATMGTAFTADHARKIRTYAPRVVTVFDGDAAGREAWHRSVEIFLTAGILAKDLTLPDKLDPDEFVHQKGAEAFEEICDKAPRQITKLIKEIASEGALSEEKKAQWLEKLGPVLLATRRLPDRATIWDSLSLVLGVSLETLKEIAKLSKSTPGATAAQAPPPQRRQVPRPPQARLSRRDLEFLKAALFAENKFVEIPAELFQGKIFDPSIRAGLEKLQKTPLSEWPDALGRWLHHEKRSQVQGPIAEYLGETDPEKRANLKTESVAVLEGLLARFEQSHREDEARALAQQVKLAQQMGNEEEQNALLQRLAALRASQPEENAT